jgi:hypothetical protein
MTDTPPAVEREFRRLIMARPAEERLLMAVSMHQSARAIALASLPPDADPVETRRLLSHRFYPELDPTRMPRG